MCDIDGFIIYLVSLLLVFLAVMLVRTYVFVSLLAFLCVAFVAAYRGEAGVDTQLYIIRFNNVGDFFSLGYIEPLTTFLMWFISHLGGEFRDFSLLYGFIVASLYLFILKKYPNARFFGLAILPVIFVDSLYNALRVGLAYPLVFLAICNASLWMYLLSFFSHVSSLLVGAFRIIRWNYVLLIFALLMLFILFVGISVDILPYRYVSKFYAYQTLSSSSNLAGIADTLALWFSITIYLRLIGYRDKKWLFFSVLSLAILTIVYIFLIKDYMFMLRVVRLMLVAVFALIASCARSYDRLSLVMCSIFGIIYAANFLRQISASCGYEQGGFLPLDYGLY